ncbi:ABC transporter permease [Salipaludibacillus sp. LMS25]|jgi:ABC-2 type transport system permease protein|uniref:ABC transporter permease n=1 Tax=Salipaludibacillus sp. LMS25 TaxID=2924031 RepID=UPI0020D14C0D|nr:ABC transporter permease [Salipaludibacillus sp. LMS25]UTR13669.1 ABC transporter permease [Salipaludibacillus sp. LMS25]
MNMMVKRVKSEWAYHYSVWKSAVDWVIWLYIFIPALSVAGYQYYLLWTGTADWPNHYPLTFTWFIFFIISLKGTTRLFIRDGDVLFLRQHPSCLRAIMKGGIIYSFIVNTLLIVIVAGLFLPLWLIYDDVSYENIASFLLFVIAFRMIYHLAKQWVSLTYSGWPLFFVNMLLTIISLAIFNGALFSSSIIRLVIILFLIMSLYVLVKWRLNATWHFFDDCVREQGEKLKLSAIFIAVQGYKMPKRFKNHKKPHILFPDSDPIYSARTADNVLSESVIKYSVRNKSKLFTVFQLTVVFMIAVVLAPFWIKWLLLPICTFALIHFIRTAWTDLTSHSFFKLYRFKKTTQTDLAIKRAIAWISLPSCFLIGFITGWAAFSPLIGLIVALITVTLTYVFLIKELLV